MLLSVLTSIHMLSSRLVQEKKVLQGRSEHIQETQDRKERKVYLATRDLKVRTEWSE